MSTTTDANIYTTIPSGAGPRQQAAPEGAGTSPTAPVGRSTQAPTSASSPRGGGLGDTPALPHQHPMPIYLGAKNRGEEAPSQARQRGGQAGPYYPYDPLALLKQLALLLALLLGLTLWLGGWQPHTSDARLGWSSGNIHVAPGTDGDTGARPLPPHDEGVRPPIPNATLRSVSPGQASRPVDLPQVFFGDTSGLAPSVSPHSGPVEA